LKVPVSVKVIDVGPSAPRNAWIADARPIESGGKHFLHARLGASGNEPLERTVRVKRLPGLGDLSQKVKITPGTFAVVNLPLPDDYDIEDKIAELVVEPRDALPDDDQFWLNLDARGGMHVLLIESQNTQIESLRPGFPHGDLKKNQPPSSNNDTRCVVSAHDAPAARRPLESRSGRRRSRLRPLQLREVELLQLLFKDLARLELHDGSLWNNHFGFGFVRISADALHSHLHLEHAEVSQLYVASVRERLLDDIERLLDGIHNLFLRETRLPVYLQHYFAFGQVRHGGSFC
jgi:hypothetical protein